MEQAIFPPAQNYRLNTYADTAHFTGYVMYLHFPLPSDKTGATIALIANIALFLSVLTGIYSRFALTPAYYRFQDPDLVSQKIYY